MVTCGPLPRRLEPHDPTKKDVTEMIDEMLLPLLNGHVRP
jgi:hypothetical protein